MTAHFTILAKVEIVFWKMRIFIALALISRFSPIVSSLYDDSKYFTSDHKHHQNEFNNQLKVSAFHYPPFLMISRDAEGSPTYKGYSFDILDAISHCLKYNLIFVPVNETEVSNYGITQAIVNQLIWQDVDMVPMVLIPTLERSLQMDFTFSVLVGKTRLMLRYPEEESRLSAIGRPFTFWTWIAIWTTVVVLVGAIVILYRFQNYRDYLKNKTKQTTRSIWELIGWCLIFVFNVITGQGIHIPPTFRVLLRFLIGLWCLAAIVIGNAYTSTLTSFLSAPKLKPIINSLEELAASDHYKLTAEKNSVPTERILKATSGYYKIIGDSLRQNPDLLFSDYQQATENVVKKNAVFLRGSIDVLTRISDDMQANNGKCRLTASKPLGVDQFLSFGVAKTSAHKKEIDIILSRLTESGLLNYWFNQYVPNIEKCMVTNNHEAKVNNKKIRSLNLIDLSSIFVLLAIGYSISFLAFLCELLIH